MQHAVKNHSCGPNINPSVDFVVLLVDEALRRHVCETSGIKIFLFEEGDGSSDSKIDYFYLFLL